MSFQSLVVSLNLNMANFEAGLNRSQYLMNRNMQAMTSSTRGLQRAIDGIPGSILKIAAAAGGLYGLTTIFRSAITAADEFQLSAIAIAAGLTNIAKPGQGDWGDIFKRNMDYAKQMARELERVAAVSPAEPAEMMLAYNQLVQQGYAARLDEADALGVIVTRIKLATAGQASNKQINQEIRAVLQGQAKDESMVAMELKNRIGPGWAEIVKEQIKSGNLLKWWASLYPGITAASNAFQMTLEAQRTTLIGNLKWLSREGMGGAYDYLVAKAQELNTWITNNGAALAAGMGTAWTNLKPTVEAAVSALVSFGKFMGEAILKMTEVIARTTEWVKENKSLIISVLELYVIARATTMIAGMSAAMVALIMNIGKTTVALSTLKGLVAGPWNPIIITVTVVGLAAALTGLRKLIQAKLEAAGVIYPNEAERAATAGPGDQVLSAAGSKRLTPAERSAFVARAKESQQIVADTLKNTKPPEVLPPGAGKGAGGGGKGGADNIQKEIEKLNKEVDAARKAAMDAENDAFNMIWKLKQDTAQMYSDASKHQYEIKGLYKDQYSTLSDISPVLANQIGYKRKALDLETDIGKATLEREIIDKSINKAQADELRGLQALTAQYKKFNAEMESDKGIRGWAWERSKSADKNNIKGMINGLESGFQNAFSSGLQGVLSQDKKTLKDIGKTMFQGLLGEMTKGSITKLFDSAAKMLRPAGPEGIGAGAGDVAGKLGTAAQGLQQASVGFNLNTAQFGLAAGGLLLSGVGIATNSQALVYAGAVLQVAGLAIQLYEALTATTTVASMTMAAGALTGSAAALGVAASALMTAAMVETSTSFIPFFHSGGPIYAHTGWPGLKSDEVPIIAQTGERVLSRRQNRDYEAGMTAGGGAVIYSPTYHINAIDARGVDKVLEKHGRTMTKVINREVGRRGRRL